MMFVVRTVLTLVSLLQLVLIADLVNRQYQMQKVLNYVEHHQGSNFNYLARLIGVTRDRLE